MKCGAQSFAMNVLRTIDKQKFQIDFAVYTNPQNGYGDEILSLGGHIHILPNFTHLLKYKKACKVLFKNYDEIHGHVTSTATIYLKIAKMCGCKTILHSHSAGYRGNKLLQLIKTCFTIRARDYADYWFACSDTAAVRVFGQDYKRNDKYHFIPNAIIVKNYRFNQNIRNIIRERYNIKKSDMLYGHVGSFTTPKNHVFLLDVFKKILRQRSNSYLILVGDGPLRDKITSYAYNLGILNNIIFTGSVSNVSEIMMAMDVLIFPSLFEGLPVTVVEAQATGLYSIISDRITRDVCLTDLVNYISIDSPIDYWVDKALKNYIPNRESYNDILEDTNFNMSTNIKFLEKLYSN